MKNLRFNEIGLKKTQYVCMFVCKLIFKGFPQWKIWGFNEIGLKKTQYVCMFVCKLIFKGFPQWKIWGLMR